MHTIFVSPQGDDQWTGEQPDSNNRGTGPLRTLEAARNQLRKLRRSGRWPENGMTVMLRGGCHLLDAGFRLHGPDDNGTADAPIHYRACEQELPRLIGGRDVAHQLQPVTDTGILNRIPPESRARVRQVDLTACGIPTCGEWRPHGYYRRSIAPLELFHNGTPLTLARWPKPGPFPNQGYAPITSVSDGWIGFGSDTLHRWAADNLQVDGYWKTDWATQAWPVTAFDPDRNRFRIDAEFNGGVTPTPGKRIFFYNVLEELREPGSYVLDHKHNRIYVLLDDPANPGELLASVLEEPLIRLNEVSHVSIESLHIECGRGDGLLVEGGSNVIVAGCTFRNLGQDGIILHHGQDHAVISCDILHTGMRGVAVGAGDRKTLTPCRHRIHNCHLHHNARRGKTYFGAISLEYDFATGEGPSCGVTITHNRLHDHPHTLLFFWGNDHRIENNEFYNFTLEGDDCGCMYAGRDFTFQGNVIRHNYFHHGRDSGNAEWGSSGIYLDDGAGGTTITDNRFLWVNRAVQAGGGINTGIERNIFVNCTPAIWFDERCASARADRGEKMIHEYMKQKFTEVDAGSSRYQQRYPNLDKVARALQEGTGVRAFSAVIRDNTVTGSRGWLNCAWSTMPSYVTCESNHVATDFIPAPDPLSIGLQDPPPPRNIGLVRDEWRPRLNDVWTRMEITTSPATNGKPGRGRLWVINRGDFPARGTERIEIRRSRHTPGISSIEVPYTASPGKTESFEFEIPLPGDFTETTTDLYLLSRGEIIRPSWVICPIACDALIEWETVAHPIVGRAPTEGRLNLRLTSRTEAARPVQVEISVEPETGVRISGHKPAIWDLQPGKTSQRSISVHLSPEPLISRVTLRAHGIGLAPAQIEMPVAFEFPRLKGIVAPNQLKDREASMARFPVAYRFPTLTACPAAGEIHLALGTNTLLVTATIHDPCLGVTDGLWDGSCVELFTATLDQARLAKVFGSIRIGHIFLVPADKGKPERLLRFEEEGATPVPGAKTCFSPLPGGYAIQAIIPFEALDLPPDTAEFLFEIQVTTGFSPAHRQTRATAFGSAAAYKDTSRFALAVAEASVQQVKPAIQVGSKQDP